jgi:hypothetical protein
MEGRINAFKPVFGKPEVMTLLIKPRRRWKGDNKMEHK